MSLERPGSKPFKISEAIAVGDKEYLAAAGRKSAALKKARQEMADDIEETRNEMARERIENEEQERSQSANYHILSPDGEYPEN